jgi:conjugative relaxase-like TrwC/TraI family protein
VLGGIGGPVVISIAKLRDASYYSHQVAAGAEDYYLGAGEAPGRWVGAGAGELGLAGEVSEEALAAVLAGRNPADGSPLLDTRAPGRRLPGFDLVCSAPKGVSLLAALAEPGVGAATRAAHDQAVGDALAYLERHGAWVRRGHNGAARQRASGLAAASFRHRTSRAAEPQLHTHLVVLNVARGQDGRASALDGRSIYAQCRSAGFVYQASLRAQLSSRLGIAWAPVANGMAEPAGIDPGVLEAFSTRRAQILAAMEANRSTSARGAQVAAWATRRPKLVLSAEEAIALRAQWAKRAQSLGLSAEVLAGLVGEPRSTGLQADELGRVAQGLVGPEGLTAHSAVFERRDVVRALASHAANGASHAELEAMADQVLGHPEVVPAGRNALGEARWSTAELVALEHSVTEAAAARTGAGAGVVAQATLGAVLAERQVLSGEQAEMVRALCRAGDGVAVVVGKAGSGKTTALEAARAAWAAGGHPVVGAALAARAAAELEAGSGITSCTLASLLNELARPEGRLGAGAVVVVDEAGMVGTRDLAKLLGSVGDAKVVLVGDPRQLPEVAAGGSFGALARGLGAISLSDNRRQREAWERAALDELRHGQVAAAVGAYGANGRISLANSAEAARAALVGDWWDQRRADPDAAVLMVALRRGDVAALNGLARARMASAGALGDEVVIAGVPWAVGDEVVGLRNDRRIGITNGTRGVVVGVGGPDSGLRIRTGAGDELALPPAYVEAGHLGRGYALTLHKAQGATVERAFLLGSEALYREAAYVGLSRARQRCDLYAVAAGDGPAGPDPFSRLVRELSSSGAQGLASAGVPASLARLGPERDALVEALAERPSPGPHVGAGLERIDAELTGVRAELEGARGAWATKRCEELEAERAGLVSLAAGRRAGDAAAGQRRAHLGVVCDAMGARVAALGQAATIAPPALVAEALGPVPDALAERRVWRAGAEAVLAYRERWGVEGAAVLGRPEGTAMQRAERAGAQRQLSLAARRLGRGAEHGLEMGQ